MVPQIKNSVVAVLVILIGIPLAECLHLYLTGELKGWAGIPDALNHASFTGFMAAIFWIFFKSPFAGRITELLQTTTTPSGIQQQTSVKITEPTAEPKVENN